MHKKYTFDELENVVPNDISVFIGMASFEKRCLTLLKTLNKKIESSILFKNIEAGEEAEINLKLMEELAGETSTVVKLNHNSPTSTADSMINVVLNNKRQLEKGSVLLDITTFTHEQLLILLKVLNEVIPNTNILIGYNGADKYSTNETENVWLSRGVDHVRTIIGYPGNFSPSKKLHLVVIVGFEHERAAAVIERFEPVKLTLLRGDKKESVSESHYETNKSFFDQLRSFLEITLNTQTCVEDSYISCVDPDNVKSRILEIASQNKDFNTVICPMNTKLSTLGVAMACIENPAIQVAYGKAIVYNEDGYSSPSDRVTLLNYIT